MMKRVTWFVGGAVAGAAGARAAKRKVRRTAAALHPGSLASEAAHRVGDAVREGRRAMRSREAELRARLTGTQPATLADELDPHDTVFVDGQPVEAAKVVVLRHPRASRAGDGGPRRRQRRVRASDS